MKIGAKGIALIKYYESLHDGDLTQIGLQPKMCPAGIWTEGYGQAMIDPKSGKYLKGAGNKKRAYELSRIKTKAQAEMALMEAVVKYERIVKSKVKKELTQNQFDALVSHAYNTGGSDTLFRLVDTGADRSRIENWFTTKYITADGKKQKGLVLRRKSEAELFYTP